MKNKTFSLIFNVKAEDKDYTPVIQEYLHEVQAIFKGMIPSTIATLTVMEEKSLHDI